MITAWATIYIVTNKPRKGLHMTQVFGWDAVYDINLLTPTEAKRLLTEEHRMLPRQRTYDGFTSMQYGPLNDNETIGNVFKQIISLAKSRNAEIFTEVDSKNGGWHFDENVEPLLTTTWQGYKADHWVHDEVATKATWQDKYTEGRITDTSKHTLTNTYCVTIECKYKLWPEPMYMNIAVVW